MSLTIGITDYVEAPFEIEREAVGPDVELRKLDVHDEASLLAAKLEDLDALLVWHAPITAAVAARLTRCRVVVRYGVGYDMVDVAALASQGIPFCNNPDYGTEEVADTAAAMILQQIRRISAYDHKCRSYTSGWQENTLPEIRRSSSLHLGIVGVGRIGTATMQRMRPFGVKLLGYDPYQPSGHEKAIGYRRYNDLHEMLADSDIVSLHCPAGPTTRGIVDEAFLAALPTGASLVNTARGSLLKSLDVLDTALRSGQIACASLDVLPDEPPGSHPLIEAWRNREPWLAGRLCITPHTAYFSKEAWREMRYNAAETALMALQRGTFRNRINA